MNGRFESDQSLGTTELAHFGPTMFDPVDRSHPKCFTQNEQQGNTDKSMPAFPPLLLRCSTHCT